MTATFQKRGCKIICSDSRAARELNRKMPKPKEFKNALKNMPYADFARGMRDETFARRVMLDNAAYLALIKNGWVQSWPGAIFSMLGPALLLVGAVCLFFLPYYVGGVVIAAAPVSFALSRYITKQAIWREFKGQGKLPKAEVERLYNLAVENDLIWKYKE